MTICKTCDQTLSEKLVIDDDSTEVQMNRLGNIDELLELRLAYRLKSDIQKFQEAEYGTELEPLFFKDRDRVTCCKRNRTSYITSDPPWRKPCAYEFTHIQKVSSLAGDLNCGKFTWGHVDEAKRRLDVIANTSNVMKIKRFCAACPVKRT